MTQLVEDLLILARSDAGAVDMPGRPSMYARCSQKSAKRWQTLADAAGIRVTTALGDRAAVISANRQALHRLFMVLLDNALKYSRAGGEVILSVTRQRV